MAEPHIKNRIELLVIKGRTTDFILKDVAKNFPQAKQVDHSLVRFYALQLKREGALSREEASKYMTAPVARAMPPKMKKPAKKAQVKKSATVAASTSAKEASKKSGSKRRERKAKTKINTGAGAKHVE